MKTALKLTFAILFSTLIVLGSSGIVLGKMICIKSGYTSYSLSVPEDCCGDEGCSDSEIKNSCCDISSLSIELNEYVTSQDDYNVFSSVPVGIPHLAFTLFSNVEIAHTQTAFQTDTGPPLSGADVCIEHCTFRI